MRQVIVLAAILCLCAYSAFAAADICAGCGQPIRGKTYHGTDKITEADFYICESCVKLTTRCYLCGVPVKENFKRLADGRCLCPRDEKAVVLEDGQVLQTGRETVDALSRLLARYLTLPETNVTVTAVDRVHLQELFRTAGDEYYCPNVYGYTSTETNDLRIEHSVSLMTGLTPAALRGTTAHEYTHAWLNENLSKARKKALSRDTIEGFCELIAYKLLDSQGEEHQKKKMLQNAYTRGQIDLFIEADNTYGFNDVIEWMKYGVDTRLKDGDLVRIRVTANPGLTPRGIATATSRRANSTAAPATLIPTAPPASPAPAPATLALKAVFWNPQNPLALINDCTLGAGEQGKAHLGQSNVVIRCLSITENTARIQFLASGEQQELKLK